MTACINAMRVLSDPADTGAVCIALPQDVEEYFFQKRVHHIDRLAPSARAIKEAAALIQRKKKPLMIFGGGVKYSEADETFQKFAEKYHIAFGETQAGKGCITWEHPLNLGGLGETGSLGANPARTSSQRKLISSSASVRATRTSRRHRSGSARTQRSST